MQRLKHSSGFVNETFCLLLAIAPLVLLVSIFGYDLFGQWQARSQMRQFANARRDADLPLGNDWASEAFRDQMSHEHVGAWSDVITAAEMLTISDDLISDEANDLRHPQQFVDVVDAEAIEQLQQAAPIIDAIERLTENPQPIWTPTIFTGWTTLLPETQGFRSVARVLKAEFQVAVALNDQQRAMRAFRLLDRFTIVTEQDCFMVSALISFAIEAMRNDIILHSLALEFWQDADALKEVQERLQPRSDAQQRWEKIWRGELVMAYGSITNQPMHNRLDAGAPKFFHNFVMPTKQHIDFIRAYERLAETTPAGSAAHLTAVEEAMSDLMPGKEKSISWTAIPFADVTAALNITFPAGDQFAIAMIRNQRDRQWTRIAAAIKRFELLHNRWPSALSELKLLGLSAKDWTLDGSMPLGYEVAADGEGAYLWTARTAPENVSLENPFHQPPAASRQAGELIGVVQIR